MSFKNITDNKIVYCSFISILISIVVSSISLSMANKQVIATSYEDTYLKNDISQNTLCPDVFEDNQCLFIKDAMRAIIRQFDEKLKREKIDFELGKTNWDYQRNEMKYQLKKLRQESYSNKEKIEIVMEQIKPVDSRNKLTERESAKLNGKAPKTLYKDSNNSNSSPSKDNYFTNVIKTNHHQRHNEAPWHDFEIVRNEGLYNLSSVSIAHVKIFIM